MLYDSLALESESRAEVTLLAAWVLDCEILSLVLASAFFADVIASRSCSRTSAGASAALSVASCLTALSTAACACFSERAFSCFVNVWLCFAWATCCWACFTWEAACDFSFAVAPASSSSRRAWAVARLAWATASWAAASVDPAIASRSPAFTVSPTLTLTAVTSQVEAPVLEALEFEPVEAVELVVTFCGSDPKARP